MLLMLFVVLMTSCFLLKKGSGNIEKLNHIVTTGSDSLILVDSASFPNDDYYINDNDVIVTSSKLIYNAEGQYKPSVKIIEIKNTKVISKNSNLSQGRVVYKIPERMKIRSTYKVLVRIAKSESVISIYDSLEGTVRTSIIPVTETMEVNLVDPSPKDRKSFEIVADNTAIQIIENGDTYTEWSWNVTPIKIGNSHLKIVVSVIRDGNKKDVVYEDSVEVEKDIPSQINFFFCKYWQWLLSTLLIPFGVWWYKKNQEDKKNKLKE